MTFHREFNTSIFTGRLSKEKMLKEHPMEYARMMAEEADIELEMAEKGIAEP